MMTDDKKLLLRMPSKLHEQIRLLAERNRRSVNAQILILIERGIRADRKRGGRNDTQDTQDPDADAQV